APSVMRLSKPRCTGSGAVFAAAVSALGEQAVPAIYGHPRRLAHVGWYSPVAGVLMVLKRENSMTAASRCRHRRRNRWSRAGLGKARITARSESSKLLIKHSRMNNYADTATHSICAFGKRRGRAGTLARKAGELGSRHAGAANSAAAVEREPHPPPDHRDDRQGRPRPRGR